MGWFLQTPGDGSSNLFSSIVSECGRGLKGGAAFAFASAGGVKLLLSDTTFQNFLIKAEFEVIVGLDAITDLNAIKELERASKKYPKLKPRLFLHKKAGSLFHPKTMWLKTTHGGVVLTGSGNLTVGGLQANWEALAVERLDAKEAASVESIWNAWLKKHKKELLDLDDPTALEKAKANRIQRARIKKALANTEVVDADLVAETAAEDVLQENQLSPVLIAEVPKSKNRWQQVNFSKASWQQFFDVLPGTSKIVRFHHVTSRGSLGPAENRPAVAVKSKNYRFEIAAGKGVPYPSSGVPIVIFEKIGPDTFKYVLLMPGQQGHSAVQKFVNTHQSKGMRRIQTTVEKLRSVWPTCPLLL